MDVGCGLVAETPLQLTQEVASRSSPPHEIAEVFIACQRIELSAPRTSMASPFPGAAPVIKVEDDEERSGVSGLVPSEQELRDKFWKDVKRRVELKKRGLYASGSAQPPPPPPPPVQPPPLPLPPPPPAPTAHHPWAKRPATAPPPGFVGVRQLPLKQYQRRSPGQRAPAQPHPPAPLSAHHRTLPGPPPAANAQRAPLHVPVPPAAPNACRALVAPTPARVGSPSLQRRPKPAPKHPAAKKKPTVVCGFCGVVCMTAWHLEQHEKGRKHLNKVARLAGEMSVTCPVCDVHLSGALNVQQHYAGKQHIWRLNLNGGA
ncbi:unnamed protein product [Urochloa humidicola]